MVIKSNGIIAKNLKPNVCGYRRPLPPQKCSKVAPISDEVKECCTNVSILELSEQIIVAENKENLSKLDFSMMLDISCLTKITAPKPIQYLNKQIFTLKIKISTGKSIYEFCVNLKGDSVMSDGSKLTDHLERKTKYKTTLYSFKYDELSPILVADIPLETLTKYRHTKFYKILLKNNKTELITLS